jgi:hypothetical protein
MPVPRYLGIDPGASGGLAVLTPEPPHVVATPMPRTGRDVFDWLCAHAPGATAVIEKVGGFIRDGGKNVGPGPAMFKFGASVGLLHGFLIALAIPFEEVTPRRWQQALGIPGRKATETKVRWKSRLKEHAQRRFPDTRVTLATADALLIALYCQRVVTNGAQRGEKLCP